MYKEWHMVFRTVAADTAVLEGKSCVLTCVLIAWYQLSTIGILPDNYDYP
jgi:hypothetical protein